MPQFSAFFGVQRPKGGYLYTEQMLIEAPDYDMAYRQAMSKRMKGEKVLMIEIAKPLIEHTFDVIQR